MAPIRPSWWGAKSRRTGSGRRLLSRTTRQSTHRQVYGHGRCTRIGRFTRLVSGKLLVGLPVLSGAAFRTEELHCAAITLCIVGWPFVPRTSDNRLAPVPQTPLEIASVVDGSCN